MALFMDRESTLNEVRTVSQPIYEVFFRVRSARWFFTMVQTKEHGAVARNNILWLKQGKNNGLNIELKGQIRACRNGTLIKLLWHSDRWGCFRKKHILYVQQCIRGAMILCAQPLNLFCQSKWVEQITAQIVSTEFVSSAKILFEMLQKFTFMHNSTCLPNFIDWLGVHLGFTWSKW